MNVSRTASNIEHNVPSIVCLVSMIGLDRLYFFSESLNFQIIHALVQLSYQTFIAF